MHTNNAEVVDSMSEATRESYMEKMQRSIYLTDTLFHGMDDAEMEAEGFGVHLGLVFTEDVGWQTFTSRRDVEIGLMVARRWRDHRNF